MFVGGIKMTSKEIVDAVISYVRDENAKYAILIDGTWGSGKTYLYENYLVDAIDSVEVKKNERKQNVYISLYGISSIDSLAKQLITNYLIYVKGNGNKLVKKGLKPLAGIIGIASSAFSFSIGPISTDLSNVFEKIEGSIDVKDMVICFDDLERCTIPINEFFGFVNNLIEHCNCKVIILADEKNIGKIYANTNIEEKYLTVISGNRKVVEYIGDGKNIKTKNKGLGKDTNGEITVEEVKKLNEILYSENYLYKDIKEKVIGKTMLYYPALKDVIKEVICGNEKSKGIIQEGQYKEYLLLAYFYDDERMLYSELKFEYLTTIIYESELWFMDMERCIIPKPEIRYIIGKGLFYYFLKDSMNGKLNSVINRRNYCCNRSGIEIPVMFFDNKKEFEQFEEWFQKSGYENVEHKRKKLIKNAIIQHILEKENRDGRPDVGILEIAACYWIYKDWRMQKHE